MKTIESLDAVSSKPGIDEIFEEHLGSNYFEDLKNLQSLENERINAMIESIGQAAAPNLNPRVVFYTTQEPSFMAKFTQNFLSQKKKSKRSVDEILKDVLDEEFFCDDYYMADWEISNPENLIPKPLPKVEANQRMSADVQPTLSPIKWNNPQEKTFWQIYVIDNKKKLENAIRSFLDFRFLHWEFDFSREFIAKSAYAALCIFVSIPFGMVAAEKMQLPINNYIGVEANVQDMSRTSQNQKEITVQVEDKTIQLPVIPQVEETQHQLMPQNLKIETPKAGESENFGEYASHTQTGQEEPVYPAKEVYEPVYDYASTEAAWVEPVIEQENKIETPVMTDNTVAVSNTQNQEIPEKYESPNAEVPEPVIVVPVEPQPQQTPHQSKPAMPAPLPSSEAFMRPASVK